MIKSSHELFNQTYDEENAYFFAAATSKWEAALNISNTGIFT